MEKCPEQDLINFINGPAEVADSGPRAAAGGEDASSWLKVRALETSNKSVEDALKLTRTIKCSRCSGMVVDLSTAVVYCGQEVPPSVIDSNNRIQSS